VTRSDLAGSIALVLTAIQFVPQVARLVRFEHREGISSVFWVLIGTQGLLWIVYALDQSLQFVSLVNSLVLIASIVILAHVRAPRAAVKASMVIGCTAGVSLVAARFLLPAAAAGTAATVLAIGCWLPQAWRASVDSNLRGLSPLSWLLTLTSSLAWWTHGFFLPDSRVQVTASAGFLASAWVLICIFRKK
jgi:uncharacterized protein with PQ loop repeat